MGPNRCTRLICRQRVVRNFTREFVFIISAGQATTIRNSVPLLSILLDSGYKCPFARTYNQSATDPQPLSTKRWGHKTKYKKKRVRGTENGKGQACRKAVCRRMLNHEHCGVFHESCRGFVSSSNTSDSEKHNSCYRQKVFDEFAACGRRPAMWLAADVGLSGSCALRSE